eukprot:5235694-Amphidinium_carterae.1
MEESREMAGEVGAAAAGRLRGGCLVKCGSLRFGCSLAFGRSVSRGGCGCNKMGRGKSSNLMISYPFTTTFLERKGVSGCSDAQT